MSPVYNFNAGPAMLPPPVLEQVQAELRDYHGRGMSIMEMSHRSKEFEAINAAGRGDLQAPRSASATATASSSCRAAPRRSSRWCR